MEGGKLLQVLIVFIIMSS